MKSTCQVILIEWSFQIVWILQGHRRLMTFFQMMLSAVPSSSLPPLSGSLVWAGAHSGSFTANKNTDTYILLAGYSVVFSNDLACHAYGQASVSCSMSTVPPGCGLWQRQWVLSAPPACERLQIRPADIRSLRVCMSSSFSGVLIRFKFGLNVACHTFSTWILSSINALLIVTVVLILIN